MRIGELAARTGLPAPTIRFYEKEGLLHKPARSESNYRAYACDAVEKLSFIQQCRALGISLAEIQRLLKLAEAPNADCGEVDVMLDEHIAKVQRQRRSLAKLEKDLKALRADCHPSRQVRGCGILQGSAQAGSSRAGNATSRKVSASV